MHELTMQTFWGTPLALLPSAILLTWIVQLRVTGLLSPGPGAPLGASTAERARVLNKASLAAGFAVACSGLAALTSGVCVVYRLAGLMPLLAMQSLALAAIVFAGAALTVETSVALRALTGDDAPDDASR